MTSGLWDGKVIWGFETVDDSMFWEVEFINGVPVVTETEGDDGSTFYQWASGTIDGRDDGLGSETKYEILGMEGY